MYNRYFAKYIIFLIVTYFKEVDLHLINGWMSGGESDLSLSLPTGNVLFCYNLNFFVIVYLSINIILDLFALASFAA